MSRPRRSKRYLRFLAWLLALSTAAGLIGHVVRDRNPFLGLLLYLPTFYLGIAAVAIDLVASGHALGIRHLRFGLAALGLLATFATGLPLLSSFDGPRSSPGDLVVLHWNVMWGGGPFRSPETWRAQIEMMRAAQPDVVVLSEAPPGDWTDRLVETFGPGWRIARAISGPGEPQWYHLVVVARGEVLTDWSRSISGGAVASFTVQVDEAPLRLLVVDGLSAPLRPRGPFLAAVAAVCDEERRAGRPYHLVTGDFNAPSRCLGFEGLRRRGFRLASEVGADWPQWRATYPSLLPWLDIDHIWVGSDRTVRSCRVFHGPSSDHRGQVARIERSQGVRSGSDGVDTPEILQVIPGSGFQMPRLGLPGG